MIDDLKPYPEYRDSGLPWLGKVPAHWPVRRIKTVLREIDRRSAAGREPLLSLRLHGGLVDHHALGGKAIPPSALVGYKHIKSGEIVMNRMRAALGLFAAAKTEGLVSPDYAIFHPVADVNLDYAVQLFRTPAMASVFRLESRGLGTGESGFLRLYSDRFGTIPIPFPPPDEQAAIVRFLGWATGQVDRAILAKRKVIALLNEQRQCIIHRAVTRGLDPTIRLKPSGIPWLGDIPQHWRIERNMALFSNRVEPGVASLPVLQVSLRSGITAEELDQFGRPKRLIADLTKYKRVYKGDVAYNTMRMWQGAVGVSPTDGLVSPAYVVLSPRDGTSSDFYDFVFHTEVYKQEVNRQSTGIVSDRNRLYWDSFKQILNVVPPLSEQAAIVDFIYSETIGLNNARSRLDREIELLREYRARLVSDVANGEFDVRSAAARLPEEMTLPALSDTSAGLDLEAAEDEEIAA